jgi:F0F1-type ATP synthase membrane subunit b/b'
MFEALIAVFATMFVLAVVIPLALCFLLLRQLSRTRAGRWVLGTHARPRGAGGAAGVPSGLRRQWAVLAGDAAAAGQRFSRAADQVQPGPLRAALEAARPEVDDAVAEAQRLAVQADRTERAYRDILAGLDSQRRRRRAPFGPAEVEASLAAATRAQHESAERLLAASQAQLGQLQLVVARLHGLTAHALELSALANTPALPASVSIDERLTALRLATAEVETAAVV